VKIKCDPNINPGPQEYGKVFAAKKNFFSTLVRKRYANLLEMVRAWKSKLKYPYNPVKFLPYYIGTTDRKQAEQGQNVFFCCCCCHLDPMLGATVQPDLAFCFMP
jgi:hypothetical protein